MRYFKPMGIVSLFCFIFMTGCASTPPQPPRAMITFDYTPQTEGNAGGADVTFAVVGARLITSNEEGVIQLVKQAPVPMFDEFVNNMTNDFMELLSARGYGVRGPFKSYDEMIHPEKEGSDLILAAEVNCMLDGSAVKFNRVDNIIGRSGWRASGQVKVVSHVNLIVYESLTNTRMWRKSIAINPIKKEINLHHLYKSNELNLLAARYGTIKQGTPFPTLTAFLQFENKFYSDVGHALQTQYVEILKTIDDYLDPREMDMVKNQSLELRKKKVY